MNFALSILFGSGSIPRIFFASFDDSIEKYPSEQPTSKILLFTKKLLGRNNFNLFHLDILFPLEVLNLLFSIVNTPLGSSY